MRFELLDGPGEFRFDANGEAFKELEFAMDMEELPKYITGIRAPLSIDAEMSFEMEKRINKKWAKKYGYVTKFRNYKLENVEIHQDGGILDIAYKRRYFLV